MSRARPNISKGTRFKVLARDRFTCQYCGRTAPYFTLLIDHVEPISKGGGHNIANFVTACVICNAGKYDMEGVAEMLRDKRLRESEVFSAAYEGHWGDSDLNEYVAAAEPMPPFLLSQFRRPLRFDFDIHAAAAELAMAAALPPVAIGDWEAF
jgi:hypothetical protein